MEVEANDALLFWGVLVMKRGPKLALKVYWKPTDMHFKCNHPHHVKRGVVHSLISQAEVVCQAQKNFSKEIRHKT
jgi:hypothetical protein